MSTRPLSSTNYEFLKKTESQLRTEFKNIPNAALRTGTQILLSGGFSEATQYYNLHKNRYNNIAANDATRVKLPPSLPEINSMMGSDYINANHCLNGQVIIAQGALEDNQLWSYQYNHHDFYHMVYTNGSTAIAMVTDYEEKGVAKCSRYLPIQGQTKDLKDYHITAIANDREENRVLRELGIIITELTITPTDTRPSKTVTHYHLPTWADQTGANALVVSAFARRMLLENKPVLHCSAGIGRSGTLAAVMSAYQKVKQGINDSNLIFNIVAELRTQRRGCVQTDDQYVTVYESLKLMLEQDLAAEKSDPVITIKLSQPTVYPLYIRGEGAGLNWNKGQALEKIDETTYGYRMKGYTGTVEYKILLDDLTWESGNNHVFEMGKPEAIIPSLSIPITPLIVEGIPSGKKLFIRGTGPGMSWDKGIELKQVGGKHVFETSIEPGAFEFKLMIDDIVWEKRDKNHQYIPGTPMLFKPDF